MSTTFSSTKIARSAGTTAKPRPKQPSRYTQARREARNAAKQRSIRHQLKATHKSLTEPSITKVRSARWPFVTLFAVIAAGAIIALLMLNTATAQTSFVQRHLKTQLGDLTVQQQHLQEQVSEKQSPTYVAKKAEELGMVPGGQPGYFGISPDGTYSFVEPEQSNAAPTTAPDPGATSADPENPAAPAPAPAPAPGATQ